MNIEYIYENHIDLIWKLAHRYNIDGIDHEDLVQEALMKLNEVAHLYDDTYAETTYIYTVVCNLFLALERKDKAYKRTNYSVKGDVIHPINDYNFDVISNKFPEYTDYEQYVIDTCKEILKDFPHKDIIVRKLYGETYKAIGTSYGISKHRVQQIFKEYIEKVKGEL